MCQTVHQCQTREFSLDAEYPQSADCTRRHWKITRVYKVSTVEGISETPASSMDLALRLEVAR